MSAFAGAAPPARPKGWAGPLFHGALLAAAFSIFAWPVALFGGRAAGAIATVLGALVAERLLRERFRAPAIFALDLLLVGLGAGLLWLAGKSALLATLVGPALSLELQDAMVWGLGAFGLALALRTLAVRFRAALAIEGGVVVLAVATTVAAHRDGMIARPLTISDWFWSQGIDPVVAFLGIGLVGAILLAAILAHGRTPTRTATQLVFVLLLGLFLATRIHGTDPELRKDVSGGKLEKDDDSRSQAQNAGGGGGQGGQAGQDSARSPFSDGLPKPGPSSGGANRPTAIVVFHKDASPSTGVYYFRHAAFSQFNGTRLIESTVGVDDVDGRFPSATRSLRGVPEDAEGREMVATDVAMLDAHSRAFGLIDAVELSPRPNPAPARFVRTYRALSSVLTGPMDELIGRIAGDPEWSEEIWQAYTMLPRDERYHRLAAELGATLRSGYEQDPMARALVVKAYLEKEATYSFKEDYDGEADPTAAFLFSEKKLGYCVHLSHAATYLLRAMGVPARVSAGYAVPASNLGGGSSLLIKAGDAHAWAEIYLEAVGWVPVEVTPEKTDVEPTPFAEQDLQQLLGEMARKEGQDEQAGIPPLEVMKWLRAIFDAIPTLLALLVLAAYAIKLWRLLAPRLSSRTRQPFVAYRAALDRLSAVGMLRALGESRERYAARLLGTAPSFGPLTAVHVASALGAPSAKASAELDALRSLSEGVGREVRARLPRWRWLLGVLNPVSWLWSR